MHKRHKNLTQENPKPREKPNNLFLGEIIQFNQFVHLNFQSNIVKFTIPLSKSNLVRETQTYIQQVKLGQQPNLGPYCSQSTAVKEVEFRPYKSSQKIGQTIQSTLNSLPNNSLSNQRSQEIRSNSQSKIRSKQPRKMPSQHWSMGQTSTQTFRWSTLVFFLLRTYEQKSSL